MDQNCSLKGRSSKCDTLFRWFAMCCGLVSVFTLSSCSSTSQLPLQKHLARNHCFSDNHLSAVAVSEVPETDSLIFDSLARLLPHHVVETAKIIGITNDLLRLHSMRQRADSSTDLNLRLELLELNEQVQQQIHNTSLEVSALAAQIDCEEERAEQIAGYLKRKEDKRSKELTVSAIVTGATGAVISGAILLNADGQRSSNVVDYIGIGTGIAEAVFGSMLLFNKKRIEYSHERNHLKCVWEQQLDESIFSRAVWRYLFGNEKIDENRAMRLHTEWAEFGPIAEGRNQKEQEALIELYFGEGGRYTADQFVDRANMLDQLEAQVSLMKEDLRVLSIYTSKI